ncbi:DUF7572 family protein [Mycobacteroides abscessus]|uniref:DUF7572 family protein n=1 Tax=Mycobacteroides abscessus TaxID=36809 RepID=UPI00092A3851|nr:hypothetical protein [Mycobacteroides abscessus]SHQ55759.1 Uncharacterised protein [Mycobacteroides abscessus subsp. abscessus]SHQ55953.1 Uncharacterised protein [Mycobacteroides abscessus subsp. abscessus]SHQ96247.1 Uncharacterised protein [Mycobacteroides abscessus subsp. abscessus]SHR08763.1 Uncharacterised protein [Mycobacteroides abscessus subsp. abscessus]SHR10952.1 Uncharacterised protein [Mycobacteroides abscessus subsp. abscessus]
MSPYTEIEAHRCISRVGTTQRHVRLQRPLRGATDVVLVPSADRARTYVFACDNAGEITDFEVLATVEGTTDAQAALAQLGYGA